MTQQRSGREPSIPNRIALLVVINPRDGIEGVLQVSDLESARRLRVESSAFMLTLEAEQAEGFVRGHLQDLTGKTQYPIQSSRALFTALSDYMARADQP